MKRLAIDIGTTNIEYDMFDTDAGQSIFSLRVPNCNLSFGLDVMTRIDKACSGRLGEMSDALRCQLLTDICSMGQKPDVICVAANTTMLHILMKYDCTPLSAFPFSPVHTEAVKTNSGFLGITDGYSVPVITCPGLNAFVGGDIVSGLSALHFDKNDNILFMDLGTNAEMVYITKNVVYISSASAGPAFETCSAGRGSDAVEALAYMLKNNVIDETGLLKDEFFESGYDYKGIHFSQRKIRDFQMAKSAIRTGLDILLGTANASSDNVHLIIAGNFGNSLDTDSAIRIGMLPDCHFQSIECMGNTALKGALKGFDFDTVPSVLTNKKIEEIHLANFPDFNDLYIHNLNF